MAYILRIDGALVTGAELEARLDATITVGLIALTASNDTTLTDAGTYYPVLGTFNNSAVSKNFIAYADGTIKYTGPGGKFVIGGTSDIEVDGAAELFYGLFNNDVLIVGAETPHDFSVQSKTENISITGIIILETDDILQVKAKTDSAGTVLTAKTLNVTIKAV